MSSELQALRAVCARDDTVIFVGSGVSMWSGLPSWPGLIGKFSNHIAELGYENGLIDQELLGGDLLLAASYASDQLTPEERCAILREAILVDGGPSDLHHAITRLGPSSFITTNYDTLLERTLSERHGRAFEVVTSAHKLEIPSIIRARATNFVFKPHGDISNCDTIILTREDYRTLQGVRRSVFEAMRTLMASRPVLFIGFGLRDPDFLLMRDQLFTTFESNPQDHLAIVSDVDPTQALYWRRNYGIRLVSYDSDPTSSNPHYKLLELIQSCGPLESPDPEPPLADLTTESATLTLARYARGKSAELAMDSQDAYPLNFSVASRGKAFPWAKFPPRFFADNAFAALARFRGPLYIEGPPGSGKSFISRQVIHRLASDLEIACLEPLDEGISARSPVIPMLIAARDYQGDLMGMLAESLPPDISIDSVLRAERAYIIIDGSNEVPPTHLADFDDDLSNLLKTMGNNTTVVTTRFSSALPESETPTAALDVVDEDFVRTSIADSGINFDALNSVTRELMRRPLFFAAWANDQLSLNTTMSVHDVYRQIVDGHQSRLVSRFGESQSITDALGRTAFAMTDGGNLSSGYTAVLNSIERSTEGRVDAPAVLEFLLDEGILIATPLRRLAFYHHSVTEYFAAARLATLITQDTDQVRRCLGRTDWDQALMLSLGFLPANDASATLSTIMQTDAAMGLRSMNFIETDRAVWVQTALERVPVDLDWPDDSTVAVALQRLPLDAQHVGAVRELANRDGTLGGAARAILLKLCPDELASIIADIASGERGYNYLNELAREVHGLVSEEDALSCLRRLDANPPRTLEREDEEDPSIAAESALGELLLIADPLTCIEVVEECSTALARKAVFNRLHETLAPEAVAFLRKEILRGNDDAIFAHYLQVGYLPEDHVPIAPASGELLGTLVSKISDERVGRWSLELLRRLSEMHVNDDIVSQIASAGAGGHVELLPALLAYATCDDDGALAALLELARRGADIDWSSEPLHAIEGLSIVTPELAQALLEVQDPDLSHAVLEHMTRLYDAQWGLELSDTARYVDWLRSLVVSESFTAFRLGSFLGRHTGPATQAQLLELFNSDPSARELLADWVLLYRSHTTIDELAPQALEWLISTSPKRRLHYSTRGLLEIIATDELTEERLLPLYMSQTEGAAKAALHRILDEIGRRLGRRYVADDGTLLV